MKLLINSLRVYYDSNNIRLFGIRNIQEAYVFIVRILCFKFVYQKKIPQEVIDEYRRSRDGMFAEHPAVKTFVKNLRKELN